MIVEYEDQEMRVREFVESVAKNMHDFNENRVKDALSRVNAWEKIQVVIMDKDGPVYYTLTKIEED